MNNSASVISTSLLNDSQWPNIFDWNLLSCEKHVLPRALDKGEYVMIIRDKFCLFCIKPYVVTSHLNRLKETVQMRGHNIRF